MLTTLSNLIFLLCLLTDEREEKRDDDDDEGTRKENATIVVVKAYRIMLFSSSFDDDDKRAYNKAYSFVVVLFPKERHFFSFRGSPLFNFSRFVKLYLGFLQTLNRIALFPSSSFGKTAACSTHSFINTIEIVVTR
jgi:hypothetical protein